MPVYESWGEFVADQYDAQMEMARRECKRAYEQGWQAARKGMPIPTADNPLVQDMVELGYDKALEPAWTPTMPSAPKRVNVEYGQNRIPVARRPGEAKPFA